MSKKASRKSAAASMPAEVFAAVQAAASKKAEQLTVLDLRWLESGADDSPPLQPWYDDPCDALPGPPAHSSPLS